MKKRAVCALLAAFLLSACSPAAEEKPPVTPSPVAVRQTFFTHEAEGLSAMVRRLSPAVVGLTVTIGSGEDSVQGLGTGFFVDPAGYILTNHHVAGAADRVTVVTEDGARLKAHTLWSDQVLDLAVVKCDEGGPFRAVTLGSVEDVAVGDAVAAVGTPLDLSFQHTVTAGIVSGMHRTLQVPTDSGLSFLEELVQTDASINPGNSGGPLVTMGGRVIGINTVKVQDAEGMGFAIPIDLARPIVERIIRTGGFETPYVGVTVIDRDIARYYGREVKEGLSVLRVDPEGPAYRAGVREGDVLLSAGDTQPDSVLAFRRKVYDTDIGQKLTLTWLRDGQAMTGACILTGRPVD